MAPMPYGHYVVLVNPRSGLRRTAGILRTVENALAKTAATLEVHTTKHPGHARELAEALPLETCEGLCVLGGDGTLHEVANGLMRRPEPARVPFGIIPGGTGNTVAEHLGCPDPLVAVQRILAGNTKPFDVMRVAAGGTTEYCVNILGWGAAVDINRLAERLRWLGPSRYTLASLWQIARARRRPVAITFDGREEQGDFFFAIGCNTQFTGKGMRLAPHADMGDGLIDVVAVRRASRAQLATLFRCVFAGTHLKLDFVEHHRVRSFAIATRQPEPLNLDGELKCATPVRVDVVPAALRVFAA